MTDILGSAIRNVNAIINSKMPDEASVIKFRIGSGMSIIVVVSVIPTRSLRGASLVLK